MVRGRIWARLFVLLLLTGSAGQPVGALPALKVAAQADAGTLSTPACALPHQWLVRIARGYRADRGADIQLVPKKPNFVAAPGKYPHSGPWPYIQRVPMLLYGPGYIRPVGELARPVTAADIAPTIAELLHYGFAAPDGRPMSEALVPIEERPVPPRLIFVLVYDAGGRVVLDAWPGQHPAQDSLIKEGAWYDRAISGSSPNSTPQIHATIGTGAFPRHHGIVGTDMRVDGRIVGPWSNGPGYLIDPTLADLYDLDGGGAPLVGLVATSSWHLGMMGHGSYWAGGDQDLAVLHAGHGDDVWGLFRATQPFYRFPEYVNDLPPLREYFSYADAADGKRDGTWRGHRIAAERGGFGTPARLPFQTRVVEEVIEREGFGLDEAPDLLFVNYKLIDEVGHKWSLNSLEMKDTVRAQDEQLAAVVELLDRHVGEGKWVVIMTADHGHTPNPRVSGAVRISSRDLEHAITGRFDDADGVPVVQDVQPVVAYLDRAELTENGYTLAGVARFLQGLTLVEVASPDTPVRAGRRDDPAFQAVIPHRCSPSCRACPKPSMDEWT